MVLAVNATVDGQTTAHYITDVISHFGVKVSRLAHGVPVGVNWTTSTRARFRPRFGNGRRSDTVSDVKRDMDHGTEA